MLQDTVPEYICVGGGGGGGLLRLAPLGWDGRGGVFRGCKPYGEGGERRGGCCRGGESIGGECTSTYFFRSLRSKTKKNSCLQVEQVLHNLSLVFEI